MRLTRCSKAGTVEFVTTPQGRPLVSLAIICLDEAENIERCIRSVPFADEVVVVDSGSKDATVEIATRLGARVLREKWLGFRDTKQLAVEKCSHDWIISLDADEALSGDAATEVAALLASPALEQNDGYEFPRLTWNLGRWIRHGGWYPDRQLRLFNRKRASWKGGDHVHERVEAARVARLQHEIHHWPFPTHAEQVATNNRYSGLGARELATKGTRFSVVKLAFKPWSKFMETYFIKRGFLDGLPGFVISVGAAYSVFLKWVKLWEIERDSRQ